MATQKKPAAKKATATKKPGTSMAAWDEQLAKYAEQAAATEANTGSGMKSFALKSGVLSFDGEALPNSEMAVIILDHILANEYFDTDYDPDTPQPRACFALGRDAIAMAPHESVVAAGQAQHATCQGCLMNEFGSAVKGRGKACGNRRRLIVIPAGTFDKRSGEFKMIEDESHYEQAQGAFLNLPVMSAQGYARYVKQLKGSLNRPPFAVVTRVKVVPDAKSQFLVTFEAIEELPAELIGTIIKRHEEAEELIMVPFSLVADDQEEAAPKKGGKATSKKPAAKTATGNARKKY